MEFIPGNRALNTIERKDAENLMMKISKSAPLGCYNYLKVFRTIFNVFVDWNYVSSNPFLKVKLRKRQKMNRLYSPKNKYELFVKSLRQKVKMLSLIWFFLQWKQD
ncbi:MAG: hypothetical protein M5T52_24015 [Ignavibacteriaceae bacterium]|nr:hypothetical protein [Ignavibacteriaceae bacterium]